MVLFFSLLNVEAIPGGCPTVGPSPLHNCVDGIVFRNITMPGTGKGEWKDLMLRAVPDDFTISCVLLT